MEMRTRILKNTVKQNGAPYDYYFVRLPEVLRKTLKIKGREDVYLDINTDKHNSEGKYLVLRLWRENDNSEFREAIKR